MTFTEHYQKANSIVNPLMVAENVIVTLRELLPHDWRSTHAS